MQAGLGRISAAVSPSSPQDDMATVLRAGAALVDLTADPENLLRVGVSHSSLFLSSQHKLNGTNGKGTFSIPGSMLSKYLFVRLGSFTAHHTSQTSPSTAEISLAQSALLLSLPNLLGAHSASCYSVSNRSGHFLVPLSGAIDNETVTLTPNRWFLLPRTVPEVLNFELVWADAPTAISDSWTLPWHCELHFSSVPWP